MAKVEMRRVVYFFLFYILSLIFPINVFADDVDTQLAKEAQNPVADLITLPFQENMNYGYGPFNKMQNVLNIEPVIPIHLNAEWNLISRTILPVESQPNFFRPEGRTNGIGDLNPTLFLSPANPSKIIWGLGPTFVFPTASHRVLGSGKWSIGPAAVILAMPRSWVLGVLAYNVWSFTGQSNRPNVNELTVQYFISYNFPKGWYLTSSPINTADWMVSSRNRWTIPLGGGAGRTFHIGKQAINLSLQAFYNVKKPVIGPDWSTRLTFALLFPE
ncbi:MAG: hypothetical protein A3F12_03700 [Gammaproteobacteria bacterium RIFCSPHIGHO2_12_FULL_38_14]|nr:MAG: hypothetical protein A3F12_03700 [Gammaproteobacteria bacterium RIFCSPHIGHO2_12_FULL_38_14]